MIEIFMFRHYDRIKQIILKIDFSNYVNTKILFQYDDEKILHFIIFYNRNMISIECNYESYDKKLLIIFRCLKHWHFKFENIEKSIKIFIDHKNLKIFMISKKLIFRQTRWTKILSKFIIVIQFQSKIQNVKIDILIRMFDFKLKNDNEKRHQYRKQILFLSKRLEIHVVKFDEFIYERILVVNKKMTIAKYIAKHSNKISFQWTKSIYRIVTRKTMFCIETIDCKCSLMSFYSLIFSKKLINFQHQIILNKFVRNFFKKKFANWFSELESNLIRLRNLRDFNDFALVLRSHRFRILIAFALNK